MPDTISRPDLSRNVGAFDVNPLFCEEPCHADCNEVHYRTQVKHALLNRDKMTALHDAVQYYQIRRLT